jgi:lipoyl synthase
MSDLRAANVDVLTFGQYLRPTQHHLPVERYVPPAEFDELREIGLNLGFLEVVSGPLVRSSYKAEQVLEKGRLPGALAHLSESDTLSMI